MILQAVVDFGGRFGRGIITDVLCGSRRKQIIEWRLDQTKAYGHLRGHRRERIVAWVDELIGRNLLRVTAEEYPRLCITDTGRRALTVDTLLALSALGDSSATLGIPPQTSDRASTSAVPKPIVLTQLYGNACVVGASRRRKRSAFQPLWCYTTGCLRLLCAYPPNTRRIRGRSGDGST